MTLRIWNLLHRDINNASPDRDQQVGIFENPTHMAIASHRVDARNPVVAVFKSTNPDGSKKYPLELSTQFFVAKILFNATRVNSKTPRTTGVGFLAGKSRFSPDPRFNGSVRETSPCPGKVS
jgi:choline dehydrogenase